MGNCSASAVPAAGADILSKQPQSPSGVQDGTQEEKHSSLVALSSLKADLLPEDELTVIKDEQNQVSPPLQLHDPCLQS